MVCPVCTKGLSAKGASHVLDHLMTHVSRSYYPYKCPAPGCHFTFVQASLVPRHAWNKHELSWNDAMVRQRFEYQIVGSTRVFGSQSGFAAKTSLEGIESAPLNFTRYVLQRAFVKLCSSKVGDRSQAPAEPFPVPVNYEGGGQAVWRRRFLGVTSSHLWGVKGILPYDPRPPIGLEKVTPTRN